LLRKKSLAAHQIGEKYRVLVIDDDKSILRTIALALEKNGFHADTAETGTEAIEKSRREQYDAVVLDLKLPDMEGTEVLSKTSFPGAVKIMLTGYPSFVSSIEASEHGIDTYLRKPISPQELVELVRAKIKDKRTSR
jgi:DNA-binding response OmpR family regulator